MFAGQSGSLISRSIPRPSYGIRLIDRETPKGRPHTNRSMFRSNLELSGVHEFFDSSAGLAAARWKLGFAIAPRKCCRRLSDLLPAVIGTPFIMTQRVNIV